MNIALVAIKNKTFTLVLTILMIGAGILAYQNLGRLEDPEFTIKDALVITYYPGATAQEVEEEVTETLETAIQTLGQLDQIESISKAGESIITVTIKDKYDKTTLPQVWDELRRKVGDAQMQLPPGAMPSIVNDDFGDVYGVLLAITGEDYTSQELKEMSDFLKRELLLVDEVAKIIVWGIQQEQIFVEISRARMAQLGVSLGEIYKTLLGQNFVQDAGSARVGDAFIRIQPTGEVGSLDAIENLLIASSQPGELVYLKDIANVSRGYVSPPQKHLRFNGKEALALGVSTVSGGNVVNMGHGIQQRLGELQAQMPLGMEVTPIYYQADMVTNAVNSFIVNLMQALAIVIVVLMIFMGYQSGMLIGAILLITVCATFVVMQIYNINLQRISLGALIIALGMLVDNAIVVTEGILIRFQKGQDKLMAVKEAVGQTMWPLFGATVIAILAFSAIGLSQDSTGEYTRSLFYVLLISLGLSWLIAITVAPLFCVMFLKSGQNKKEASVGGAGEVGEISSEPYQGGLYRVYQKILMTCLTWKWVTLLVVLALLGLSVFGFGLLEDSFFPNATSPQFFVHYWLPEGTDIRKTSEDLRQIEAYIQSQEGVESVATFVGDGAPRFMLVYSPEKSYDSYGLALVTVNDYRRIDGLIEDIESHIAQQFLDANPKIEKIRLGPGGGYAIEGRFSGEDPTVLRGLSNQAQTILREGGMAKGIRDNWRERTKVIRPQLSLTQARRVGISRQDLARTLQMSFMGTQAGLYREKDELIPILHRAPEEERGNVDNLEDIQIWSDLAKRTIPIRQVVSGFTTEFEDPLIHRRNKKRTITTQADPLKGNASVVFDNIHESVENLPLPIGYEFEWGGEYEDSKDAKAGLAKNIPVTFLLMVLVTIGLFNAIRQPLIIWLTVPLAIIGVTVGLLLTGESFGFMALLGFLSLVGMLIKNAIVLIDEIDLQIKAGKTKQVAILDGSVSRLRPVSMAAVTTILGMIPLLKDVFFIGMAVTIMSGLAFATLLTLIVVPVFYAVFFRVKIQKGKG